MGGGLPPPYGDGGVEEQHPLAGPAVEAAVIGPPYADVVLQLGEDVLQRRRQRDAGPDGEAQAVGLVGAVVRVLPEDEYFHRRVGREVEGGEDLVGRRVDPLPGPLRGDELLELLEVGSVELRSEDRVPVRLGRHVERPYLGGAGAGSFALDQWRAKRATATGR